MTDTTSPGPGPETAPAQPAMLPLACTYCGDRLYVNLAWEGSGYVSSQYAESIECENFKCGAVWEPTGTPRTPARWIAYPDLYAAPEPKDA